MLAQVSPAPYLPRLAKALQRLSYDAGSGRPFAGTGLTPLGSLLGGFLAVRWGLRTSLLLTAAAMALSPLFMALSPLARLGKSLPDEHQPGTGRTSST